MYAQVFPAVYAVINCTPQITYIYKPASGAFKNNTEDLLLRSVIHSTYSFFYQYYTVER